MQHRSPWIDLQLNSFLRFCPQLADLPINLVKTIENSVFITHYTYLHFPFFLSVYTKSVNFLSTLYLFTMEWTCTTCSPPRIAPVLQQNGWAVRKGSSELLYPRLYNNLSVNKTKPHRAVHNIFFEFKTYLIKEDNHCT